MIFYPSQESFGLCSTPPEPESSTGPVGYCILLVTVVIQMVFIYWLWKQGEWKKSSNIFYLIFSINACLQPILNFLDYPAIKFSIDSQIPYHNRWVWHKFLAYLCFYSSFFQIIFIWFIMLHRSRYHTVKHWPPCRCYILAPIILSIAASIISIEYGGHVVGHIGKTYAESVHNFGYVFFSWCMAVWLLDYILEDCETCSQMNGMLWTAVLQFIIHFVKTGTMYPSSVPSFLHYSVNFYKDNQDPINCVPAVFLACYIMMKSENQERKLKENCDENTVVPVEKIKNEKPEIQGTTLQPRDNRIFIIVTGNSSF